MSAEQGPDPEWFANDELWEATYAFMFPQERMEASADEVRQIFELTSANPPLAVLDLGCGPGRHSVELARLGCEVTAVDRSTFLLDRARERGADAGVEVEWVQSDMREFERAPTYRLALNLFTSFGFFDEPADNQRVLDNLFTCVLPGGSLVLDVAGKEVLSRIWQPTWSLEVDGGLIVQRRRVMDGWARLSNEWLLIRDGDVRRFTLQHWVYSGRELAGMLEAAGFETVSLFGSFQGAPYDQDARRLVAVARKA